MRVPVLAITLLAAGCGGQMAQLRRDNQRLAGELAGTRAELRGERRKTKDLSTQILLLTDRLDAAAVHGGGAVAPPPPLPVEILGPGDVSEDGDLLADGDDGEGASIVFDGGEPIDLGAELSPRRPRAAPRDRDRDLAALPTSTELREPRAATSPRVAPPAPTAADDEALALYQRAMTALKARDHATAIATFRALIAAYPRHDYADNAQYWLGEAFYDQKDYAHALPEFRATVSAYPLGNKVPDALLKVGLSYAALGESAKARAALEQVIRQFPKSPSASIATSRLEQLP